jgi:hypothetical protein
MNPLGRLTNYHPTPSKFEVMPIRCSGDALQSYVVQWTEVVA